jgi:hypothetical protein
MDAGASITFSGARDAVEMTVSSCDGATAMTMFTFALAAEPTVIPSTRAIW